MPQLTQPIVDDALIQRIDDITIRFDTVTMEAEVVTPARPHELRHFGPLEVHWSTVKPMHNQICGLTEYALDALAKADAWYRERDATYRLHVRPDQLTRPLSEALRARGYRSTGYYAFLYKSLTEPPPEPESVTILEYAPEDKGAFAAAYFEGFDVPKEDWDTREPSLANVIAAPGVTAYWAEVEGQVAATAMLYIDGPTAYLAAGSALQTYRKRGCHSALIAARMRDAYAAGCDLIVGTTNFNSSSGRNMQRAGLRHAYTPLMWAPEYEKEGPWPE